MYLATTYLQHDVCLSASIFAMQIVATVVIDDYPSSVERQEEDGDGCNFLERWMVLGGVDFSVLRRWRTVWMACDDADLHGCLVPIR